MHFLEQKQYAEIRALVERDFDQFSGTALESYFRAKFLESGRYTKVSGWWDRKGENEIDLVCENELKGTLDFYEVKCDASRVDLSALNLKVAAFFLKHPDMRRSSYGVFGLSRDDM